MALFYILRAPYADFSPPCTVIAKKVPWRPFQGIPRCGSLAGIHSVLSGIAQVSRYVINKGRFHPRDRPKLEKGLLLIPP